MDGHTVIIRLVAPDAEVGIQVNLAGSVLALLVALPSSNFPKIDVVFGLASRALVGILEADVNYHVQSLVVLYRIAAVLTMFHGGNIQRGREFW
jgi:type III secretory pathway component EscR